MDAAYILCPFGCGCEKNATGWFSSTLQYINDVAVPRHIDSLKKCSIKSDVIHSLMLQHSLNTLITIELKQFLIFKKVFNKVWRHSFIDVAAFIEHFDNYRIKTIFNVGAQFFNSLIRFILPCNTFLYKIKSKHTHMGAQHSKGKWKTQPQIWANFRKVL